jgi:hypothetical protein
VSIVVDEALLQQLERKAAAEDRSVSNLALRLIKDSLATGVSSGGDIAQQSETLELLLGFLNYLIDHFDHDGYSLAEISQILGRSDDKGLVALVQKLQNGQGQAKPGVKSK